MITYLFRREKLSSNQILLFLHLRQGSWWNSLKGKILPASWNEILDTQMPFLLSKENTLLLWKITSCLVYIKKRDSYSRKAFTIRERERAFSFFSLSLTSFIRVTNQNYKTLLQSDTKIFLLTFLLFFFGWNLLTFFTQEFRHKIYKSNLNQVKKRRQATPPDIHVSNYSNKTKRKARYFYNQIWFFFFFNNTFSSYELWIQL